MKISRLSSFSVVLFLAVFSVYFSACKEDKSLPYYGKYPVKIGDTYDTITKTIPPFEFYDQDSTLVTNKTFENSIYIADFFFTSCPSICPVMKRQMLRIQEAYPNPNEVKFLSHTIDPERDDVAQLKQYATKLGIADNKQWHFVTGYKDQLYLMAEEYMISAYEDGEVPGGFEHSGQFILVDKNGMIRGYYDGTNEDAVSLLIRDIETLMNEK